MSKTQEQRFLEVKEKLDYYRLPTVFPIEALDLLSQLLSLLQNKTNNGKENQSINGISSSNDLNDALRLEIGKVVKQNNRLHMEILSAKEQIMALNHSNDKFMINRSGTNQQMTLLIQNQRRREEELFQELTQVKFKYNELMDLVHEDSEIQKKYIKRLMKHRKMDCKQQIIIVNDPILPANPELKKGQHQTVAQAEAKLVLLKQKLANRENQILRLQKKTQYDGLNMNKILKDFQNQRTDNQIKTLQEQIEYLEAENKKMKDEVTYCRKNGGSKEALREEMRKNHETIANLNKENRELKKSLKIKDFDGKAKEQKDNRENKKIRDEWEVMQDQLEQSEKNVADLEKKIQFLNHELGIAKSVIQKGRKELEEKTMEIDEMKNSEEGNKILAQYEVQSLKQKVEELETELDAECQKGNQLKAEINYHKHQDRLKNEAIENLEKIVDELMKRNNDQIQSDYNSSNLDNTIALRKNLAQMKQQLVFYQNEKDKLQRQVQTLLARLDQKNQETHFINEQLNRCKIRILEMKNNEDQFSILQREVAALQSDLKKQQNFRYKIDQLHQQAENDKSRLRKELQQLTQEFQIYEKKSKTHLNSLKMQNNELEQANRMLELVVKEKEKKIVVIQTHSEELASKMKLMKEEISLIEDQKLNAIREKHKFQKKCQDIIRINNETNSLNQHTRDLEKRSLQEELIQYEKQVKKLHQKILVLTEQINQLNIYCDTLKLSEETLSQENKQLKREMEKLRDLQTN